MSDRPDAVPGRKEILDRVREATRRLGSVEHPGSLGARAGIVEPTVLRFSERFRASGGEVVDLDTLDEARDWLSDLCAGFREAAVGRKVPDSLRPPLPGTAPESADLGVSVARFAVAETGSILLDSRDGRRVQLLPPTHLVWIDRGTVVGTLAEALERCRGDRPSAIGIHSGPSKSADIGRVIVTGVHGPGRVIAAIVGAADGSFEDPSRGEHSRG